MIRQIVGRCHVSETNREVIRFVISRLSRGYQTFRALPKSKRRMILEEVVLAHKENRNLYRAVMNGTF